MLLLVRRSVKIGALSAADIPRISGGGGAGGEATEPAYYSFPAAFSWSVSESFFLLIFLGRVRGCVVLIRGSSGFYRLLAIFTHSNIHTDLLCSLELLFPLFFFFFFCGSTQHSFAAAPQPTSSWSRQPLCLEDAPSRGFTGLFEVHECTTRL